MGLTGFRGRVVSLAVLTATLVVAVLVIVSHVLLSHATDADTRTLARTRAAAEAATVEVRNGAVRLVDGSGEAFDTVAWVYVDGRVVDGVPHPATATHRLSTARHPEFSIADHYLLYAEPVPAPGHRVVVAVVVDLTPYESAEQRSLLMSLLFGGLAVVLAGAVAYLGVNRALRAVRRMSALADQWGAHDVDRRFGLGPPRDELGELAQTFDRLLDRVSDTIADERRLTDEIAHELRTPMTVLRGEAQLAGSSGVDPRIVLTETDRLDAAVTTLLDAARSRRQRATTCDLTPVLQGITAGRDVEVTAPPDLQPAIAAEVVTAILTPLLDNAIRHARTSCAIRVEAIGNEVVIHVLDDGPGFHFDEVERAFTPGHSTTNGHGLGLAVVRRITTATGIDVRAVADGNGHVEVRLPRA